MRNHQLKFRHVGVNVGITIAHSMIAPVLWSNGLMTNIKHLKANSNMKTQQQNPNGLHRRYHIQKIAMVPNPNYSATAKVSQVINNHDPYIEGLVPVDKGSEYFVLRLDTGGSDINHIKAGRIAIQAYADAIEATIPKLAADLRKRYPLL